MESSKRYSIDGRMVCIDFKKAFDTVGRDFLFRTLSVFGCGLSFIQWTTLLTRMSRVVSEIMPLQLHSLQLKEE